MRKGVRMTELKKLVEARKRGFRQAEQLAALDSRHHSPSDTVPDRETRPWGG